MNELQRQVLEMLLAGDDPVLSILRRQLAAATCTSRELTGVGFFANFDEDLSSGAPPIPGEPSFAFGDVHAEIEGIEHGAGFVLFVTKGRLNMLEGYTYDEPWPDNPTNFSLTYMDEERRDISALRTRKGWPTGLQ